ncbi:iron ABC transporter ATP-binding protein [Parasphaerochaeta coccoides]|uniref:Iron-chelate-transporting ATPase n=1 Tax=Parasphaerochaeta coccoides (strain ATCC BAA-1237 / DSM 17374 / SPN1) TaxID=760011 RepID=F4GL04_PARC1|nr:ATP-binding cassette domain-containing protein [Parasphaerochaeta coccoides]AEC02344.1 Iron-chelate-transporting ATPase [Parasphaerochaeta coccoides DSM 17374]
MITTRNVSKSYGARSILADVDITVLRGGLTALVGPNGAGKSTLLSIIGRLISAGDGVISIDGKSLADYSTHDLSTTLSTLRQSNHSNVRLSVQQLVEFGRHPYSRSRLTSHDQEIVKAAIRQAGMESFADRYIDQLSGGERQRAYIAMILAQDTPYVLLDEPLNNLDMKHATQIMRVLRRMADKSGKTVVVVLHDINFAASWADRIIALKDGKVLYSGSVDEVISPGPLKDIFDLDITVTQVNGRKVCLYYS